MDSKVLAQRYLVLLKIDASNLYHRIKDRCHEFMDDFSLKRDRSVFRDVFYSRYPQMSMHELSHFSVEVIELVNAYYQKVDELHWYLMQTQDMPTTIEDEVIHHTALLGSLLENLTLYIDAEMSPSGTSQADESVTPTDLEVESSEEWSEETDF